MLSVLHTDRSKDRTPTKNILHALEVLGTNLDDYLHLIVPAVVKLLEHVDVVDSHVRLSAIQTLGRLANKLNFSDNASRIIHPLSRILDGDDLDLKNASMVRVHLAPTDEERRRLLVQKGVLILATGNTVHFGVPTWLRLRYLHTHGEQSFGQASHPAPCL